MTLRDLYSTSGPSVISVNAGLSYLPAYIELGKVALCVWSDVNVSPFLLGTKAIRMIRGLGFKRILIIAKNSIK